METSLASAPTTRISIPVVALALYAVASGYLMSLIPLMLPHYELESSLASWLASIFYAGLLVGAIIIEPVVKKLGHKNAFIYCLITFVATIALLPLFHVATIWMASRFIAGIAVAGVFVIVESWLLHGDESARAKRLGLYMGALYGGTSIGQLGISVIGVSGHMPFITIFTMLVLAIAVLIFGNPNQPQSQHGTALSLKQIAKLNHAAIIGCMVSGLTLGAIYGLMPIELTQLGITNDELGSLMALIILGGMAVQPMIPWMSKILGRTYLMAILCILGVAALALTTTYSGMYILSIALFLLGMATFAMYPVAINLGCEKLDSSYIVSATQVMLFSYSIGSVAGPILAHWFMTGEQGLMTYLFTALLATCIYMLIVSIKTKRQAVAGE